MFKLLGITVTEASDGTYIIDKYKPKVTSQYTLSDLGVNENKLMQNVTTIKSTVNLEGSKLTALPKLRVIHGSLSFGDNRVSDLRNLEKIGGKTITWDK